MVLQEKVRGGGVLGVTLVDLGHIDNKKVKPCSVDDLPSS
jgi:hypothetical protein